MSEPTFWSRRLPDSGKFWLKRARIDAAHLAPDAGDETPGAGPDGTLLADLRIEDGRIRAVLPAGEAPCCAPGLDLDGGAVRPLAEGGRIGPGRPADLTLAVPQGGYMDMLAGRMADAIHRAQ